MHHIPLFGEVISKQGASPDPRKVQTLTDVLPPKTTNKLQSFLGILNYTSAFSPVTAGVFKPLLTQVKTYRA